MPTRDRVADHEPGGPAVGHNAHTADSSTLIQPLCAICDKPESGSRLCGIDQRGQAAGVGHGDAPWKHGIDTNIANGLRRGERELDLELAEVPWAVDPVREFQEFVATGPEIVVTDALIGALATDVIIDNPDVEFGVVDWAVDAPNATFVTFAGEERGYLAGAAAALRTDTGRIGFILGADVAYLDGFRAGLEAGVQSIDPDIETLVRFVDDAGNVEGFFP